MNGEIHKCKNDYSWNFSTCIFDNKYLKSIVDTSVIACDGFILEIVSTIMTKTVATDVLINWHSEKARYKTDYYILGTYLSAIILILIITIICYHYAKHRSKQKGIDALTI